MQQKKNGNIPGIIGRLGDLGAIDKVPRCRGIFRGWEGQGSVRKNGVENVTKIKKKIGFDVA